MKTGNTQSENYQKNKRLKSDDKRKHQYYEIFSPKLISSVNLDESGLMSGIQSFCDKPSIHQNFLWSEALQSVSGDRGVA